MIRSPVMLLLLLNLLGLYPGAPVLVQAQTLAEPVFTEFGMDAGLSQGSVNALLQDELGFLWVGTHDGLNRFDGLNFRAFKNVRDDTTSLSDDYVRSIALGPAGQLWVGTERGGLNLFDPQTGRSRRYPMHELGPWEGGREGRTVRGIVRLGDGSLVLDTDRGLALFASFAGGSVTLIHPPGNSAFPDPPAAVCPLDGGGGLVGFGGGAVWRIGVGGTFSPGFVLPDSIQVIRCPVGGLGLVGTRDGGIYSFDSRFASIRFLTRVPGGADVSFQIQDLIRGPNGLIWIATTRGLFFWREGRDVRSVGVGGAGPALPSSLVNNLLVDNTGLLWVGTWNGLLRIHPFSQIIRRIPLLRDADTGLFGAGVVAIEQASRGLLWVGTLDGGVQKVDLGSLEIDPQISRDAALEPWETASVFGLARRGSGELWIATRNQGMILFHRPTGRARPIPVIGRDGVPLWNASFYSVFVDEAGVVWAGTGDAGLIRYDTDVDGFLEYKGPGGGWDFGSDWVWPIIEDDEGRLWVGAFNGGVSVIDADRQTQERFEAGPGMLSDNRVLTLYSDSRGLIWIGTQGGGLNRLDPKTSEIKVFTVEDGLPHDHVEGVAEDDQGFLWITTNDGLARMDPDTEEFWVLKEGVGLSGDRFHANAVFRLEDGHLAFGGEDGLTLFEADRVTPSRILPRVVLTELRIQGHPVPLSRALGDDGLLLEPEENFFTFEFAALNSTDPTQNQYEYMLEGLDEAWIEASPGQVANYTAVRPGRYAFRVRARNADGVWNRQGLTVPVRVQTPYYLTWWFLALSTSGLGALLTWIVYARIKEHHRRLEVAGHLHDGIGASIASIIRVLGRVEEKLEPGHPGREDLRRLDSMADWAKTETQAAVKILRKGKEGESLAHLIKELRDTADWMLAGNVEDYRIRTPDKVPRRTVNWKARTDAFLLVKEALNNVLKHAEASFVEVEVRYQAPNLFLRITDDGKGFEPGARRDGNGLDLMRSHSTRHGGRDPVRSAPGEGTTVETKMRIH